MKHIILFIFAFSFLSFASAEDKIPILYFYEADCPYCAEVNESVMPLIIDEYGDSIRIIKRNVDKIENFEAMMAFETKYSIPPQEVPEFYTALGVTWNPDKIGKELPGLIEKQLKSEKSGKYAEFLKNYLKTGDTGISLAETIQKQYLGNQKSEVRGQGGEGGEDKGRTGEGENRGIGEERGTWQYGLLKIYEFRKYGCRSCDRLSLSLRYLKKKFPNQVLVKSLNIKDSKSKILNEAFCIKYDVEEIKHLATPALFFGKHAFAGKSALRNLNIVPLVIDSIKQLDEFPTKNISDADIEIAKEAIYKRFTAISWTAVVSAGLLDGVNPCAFVTIIFLLSYLAMMKYSRRDIALVGISFTIAVFLTYLLIGLGFLKFVSFIQELPFLNDIIYYFAIAFAAIIGLLNLKDYYKIKKGSLTDMNLKLSKSMRQRINAVIRKNVKLRHYIIGAFGMGFAISLLELACTGQVYLPTVLFIINTQGIKIRAVLLLIAYNIAFIVPLIVIFALFWHGSTEKRISQWLQKHGAKIKLAMGLLFIFLAVFLYLFK
jgi:cytochrome c biogenesis protein CcdA